jgi:putative ABC transport system permease protein
MSALKQISAVTSMNLRSIPQRWGASLVIVVGIAGVVAVLVSMMAMATGFTKTVEGTGRPDRVLIIRGGSGAELGSSITRDQALTIKDAPGIKKDASGQPIASAEAVVMVNLPKKGDTNLKNTANVAFRGVQPAATALRPEIKIISGRTFQPAVRELIAGKSAQAQFQGLDVGAHLMIRDTEWTVVGIFESNGDSNESGLMADADTVISAYRRPAFQSVSLMLDSPDSFTTLKDSLTTNPTMSVDVMTEPQYYAQQSERLGKMLFFISYVVGGIMAIGALFGALNTMYAAVSARSSEIATLRAIGFGAGAVVISVLAEALLLAASGGLIGGLLAWATFNGNVVNTLGGNFTQVVFPLTVTPGLLITGIVWACTVGLLGGLFPSIRVARMQVAMALQAQ